MDVDIGTADTEGSDTEGTVVPFVGIAAIKSGFKAGYQADAWRLRGKYYDDYYKNTGKRPRYYSRLTRRRYKW